MKVRCVKLLDSRGNHSEQSPWLTLEKAYHVLAVELDTNGKWLLRLVGDGLNGVALFSLDQFEMTSSKIPPSWIIWWRKNGLFELAPEPWTRPGFWEDFYDGKPEARRIFEEERGKIIDAGP